MMAQTACPHCHLMTPAWRDDCIHCGLRTDIEPTKHPLAAIRRTYPAGCDQADGFRR